MTTEQEPGSVPHRSRRSLVWSIVLMLAASGLLWAASSLVWFQQRYRTPFSGDQAAGIPGGMVRPELVPLALATLAAIAAVLATGGWMRRLIGLLVALEGGLLAWRVTDWLIGSVPIDDIPQAPPGSEPLARSAMNPLGPMLMSLGALLLLAVGLLVVLRAGRMPAMGAKYSTPATAKQESRDPDRQWWDALDEGDDPTDPAGGHDHHS
ncbi:Trp biosynthesis-associated membrane protein [Haloactinomyces albus]|uniref:Membrane protein (TIGR02234 family) n=1 Tax=Haloactinomyces albus TaxID=1352928 RepID=A0AAE4CKM3_9ACTN|nr:Trp biosynthesis-associated membrane protein [Haloactinomyces albus]MDR7300506.1 putative membrane protein (TIGR02234 family) [Haloactinomyces albus]